MLLGIWKNVEELESCVSLIELQAILKASRDAEYRNWKFHGSIQGIDIGEGETTDAEERFKEIERRANARLTGISEEKLEMQDFGLDFEEG